MAKYNSSNIKDISFGEMCFRTLFSGLFLAGGLFAVYFVYCMIFPGYQPYTYNDRMGWPPEKSAEIAKLEMFQLGCFEYREASFLTQRLVPWYRERAFCALE